MSITLRIILIVFSLISFGLCVMKIKQSKLKMNNSIIWMVGSFLLILMSIFTDVVGWISSLLGFMAPVNFVFFIIITFLLIEVFLNNMAISNLNEKVKDLDHYIAIKEKEEEDREKEKNNK